MSWLVFAFALQLGYIPEATAIMYQPPPRVENVLEQGLVSFDAEARLFKTFYVGGSVGIPVWQAGELSFWPSELQSVVRAGVRFGGLEIGWSHLCTHPVMPYQPLYGSQALWEGFYDEIHIKLSGEIQF